MKPKIKPPNFIKDGRIFLVKCPKRDCREENNSLYVAYGKCAWCGYNAHTGKRSSTVREKVDAG